MKMNGRNTKINFLTVDDLLLMNSTTISLRQAAKVLGWGYDTVKEMAHNGTFPCENCIIQIGPNGGKYAVMRIKLITFITGENYEEQREHKRKLMIERKLEKEYIEEEKRKIDMMVNTAEYSFEE